MEEEPINESGRFMPFPTITASIVGHSDLRDKFERSLVI